MKKQLKAGVRMYFVAIILIALALVNDISINAIIKVIIGLTIIVLLMYILVKRKNK